MMRPGELVDSVPGVSLVGGSGTPVIDVTIDSRAVAPGWLFAALPGERVDGRSFIPDALRRGAGAILSNGSRPADLPADVAWIDAVQPRAATALLARRLHGAPDDDLDVIGITGTDGKTTTAHLLGAALEACGWSCATGGTLGQRFREVERDTVLTTPEAPELYRFLAEARRAGARAAVLEVSSAALVADRVHGMRFAGAILTGIGQDHLDLHGTVGAYAAAKRRLFAMLRGESFGILPAEDPWTASFEEACSLAGTSTFGEVPQAEWMVSDHRVEPGAAWFSIRGPGLSRREVRWSRLAPWDTRNLAAAVAAASALGADPETALMGACQAEPVPGRWERIDRGQSFMAIVDYAHTPRALERALGAARRIAGRQVLVVFGCGGDRDHDKRPVMGEIAARLADVVIVTDDNPRSEDPEAIAGKILEGVGRSAGDRTVKRIGDRREAIETAVRLCRAGDVLLVAGRGHESHQKIGDRRVAFDDRVVLSELLESAGVSP